MVRLSAGRESMSESTQALCFMAGANSIFTGDKLLTTGNAGEQADAAPVRKARGCRAMEAAAPRQTAGAQGETDVISLFFAGLLLAPQQPNCADPQTQADMNQCAARDAAAADADLNLIYKEVVAHYEQMDRASGSKEGVKRLRAAQRAWSSFATRNALSPVTRRSGARWSRCSCPAAWLSSRRLAPTNFAPC
jgi:uncharacterized protein YecT (DUF1311 family)